MHEASLFHSTGLLQIKKRAVKKKKNENGVIVWLICATQQEVSNFFMVPTSGQLFNTCCAVPAAGGDRTLVHLAYPGLKYNNQVNEFLAFIPETAKNPYNDYDNYNYQKNTDTHACFKNSSY